MMTGQMSYLYLAKITSEQTAIFMVSFHYLVFLRCAHVLLGYWAHQRDGTSLCSIFLSLEFIAIRCGGHLLSCQEVIHYLSFFSIFRSSSRPSTHLYSLNSPTLLDTTHGSIFSQVVHRNEHIIPPILLALTFLLLPTPPLFLTELMPTNSLHNNTQHVTRINQHNITPHFLLCWLLEVRMIFPDAHTSWTDVVLAEPPMETLSSPNIIIIRWFFLTCGRFSLERKKRWGWWTTWL